MDKDDILKLVDLEHKEITVPAWNNKKIFIRQLSGMERAEIDERTADMQGSNSYKDNISMMALVCCYVICDEHGKQLLSTDKDDPDIGIMATKKQAAIEYISTEGMKYSAIDEKEKADIKKK